MVVVIAYSAVVIFTTFIVAVAVVVAVVVCFILSFVLHNHYFYL